MLGSFLILNSILFSLSSVGHPHGHDFNFWAYTVKVHESKHFDCVTIALAQYRSRKLP